MWVLTSVDDVTAGEAASHLDEDAEHHEWTLQDLSIIWQTLLGRGRVRPLLRGFELFQRVRTDEDVSACKQKQMFAAVFSPAGGRGGLSCVCVSSASGVPPGVGVEDVRAVLRLQELL